MNKGMYIFDSAFIFMLYTCTNLLIHLNYTPRPALPPEEHCFETTAQQ